MTTERQGGGGELVKLYELFDRFDGSYMEESADGEWVRLCDYRDRCDEINRLELSRSRLQAERDELRRRISEAPVARVDYSSHLLDEHTESPAAYPLDIIGKKLALVVLDTAGDGLEPTGGMT